MHRFTLPDGCRLHYRIQGPAGAPWMVLLNGLLSDLTMWSGCVGALSRSFRVLSFDSRGQGRSDAPEGLYTVAQRAEDALALLDELGIARPWLVGLSNGAAVGLELMAWHPGCWAGGVLVSAAPGVDLSMRLKLEHWIDCFEAGGPELQFGAVAPFLWGDAFLERRHAVLKAYHASVTGTKGPDAARGSLNQIRGALASGLREDLHRIKDPLLLLAGAEDLLTPPWKSLRTAQSIPGSVYEIVPGIGHAYPVEDPKGFSERVLRFVKEVGKAADNVGLPSSSKA